MSTAFGEFPVEEQVEVVGHDDEGVEFVEALRAVVPEDVEEQTGVGVHLEEVVPLAVIDGSAS